MAARKRKRRRAPDLRARWMALWHRAGGNLVLGHDRYRELDYAYDEIHRRWHRLRHVHVCLRFFDRYRKLAKDPDAVEFAIWFHRAVLFTDSKRWAQSLPESAQYAYATLAPLSRGEAFAKRVAALIMSLDTSVTKRTGDEILLRDCERAVFAATATVFDEYDALLRNEYGWISLDSAWIDVRLAFLKRLDRKSFFGHADIEADYGTTARRNLLRAMVRLRAGRVLK